MPDSEERSNAVELATELTIAWLSNPNTRASTDDVPPFLRTVYEAVAALSMEAPADREEPLPEYTPAVTVRKSLSDPEVIISLIDGRSYKTLKRHLANNGLTPDQYRQRYGLKPDYPMVAPAYAEIRRGLAKKIGLGRKPGQKSSAKPAVK